MKRLTLLVASFVLLVAPAAFAQTPSQVADALQDDGIYVEPPLSVDLSELRESVQRARDNGLGFYVVLLDEDPPSGATAFADGVLSELGTGTVLVLSAGNEGMSSTERDRAALEEALDAGFEAGGGDEGYVRAVVSSLTGTSPAEGEAGDGGGGSGLIIMLIIIGLFVGLVWWAIRRSSKASKERRAGIVGSARAEIKEQLDSMANTILEISDKVSASGAAEDDEFFEKATATYTEALESYESATDLGALEDLSDKLDEARWQLDAAAAIAEGRDVPPKPEKEDRPVCFFDPTHRDATEMVDIQTATGTRTVRVCKADAERIREGRKPEPRMIEVEGEKVPAPMAPRSHGGGGMDWLDVFSVAPGGSGEAMSYDWGTRHMPKGRRAGRASAPKQKRSRAGRERRRRR